ncbi:MAG: alpha/beta fold hydrolase [Clostridiales bacterium]|nr:alpha/beta fold hydrolase [Clostridiales bacterium]
MYTIQFIEDVVFYGTDRERLRLDLFVPEGKEDFTTIVLFFGGGLTAGAKEDLAKLAEALTAEGYGVVTPNYRYYPDYPFPTPVQDAAAALHWVRRSITNYGGSGKIFVGGHSAGAYLSMMLAFDKRFLSPYDIDPDQDIAGWLMLSGQPTLHFNIMKFEGTDPRRVIIDDRAPLYHVNRSEGAPMLILCSDNDIPNRLLQNELLVASMKAFSYASDISFITLQGHDHVSYMLPDADGRFPIMEPLISFIESH